MIYPSAGFLEVFKATPGALSVAESLSIMWLADQSPEGTYIELGTHKGKSAMSAALVLQRGLFYLVEPEFADNKFKKEALASIEKGSMRVDVVLMPIANYSTNVIHGFNDFSFVFVDSGSHQDGLPMQEAKLLEDKLTSGGIIAWHDFKNQFREPAEAADYLVSTGKYEWIDIPWQPIFDYVNEHNLEEGNNSWHTYPDLGHPPNFVGAVRRK